jgi:predicted ABC-class ATPase
MAANRKARRNALRVARARGEPATQTVRKPRLMDYGNNLDKMRKAWGFAGYKGRT